MGGKWRDEEGEEREGIVWPEVGHLETLGDAGTVFDDAVVEEAQVLEGQLDEEQGGEEVRVIRTSRMEGEGVV